MYANQSIYLLPGKLLNHFFADNIQCRQANNGIRENVSFNVMLQDMLFTTAVHFELYGDVVFQNCIFTKPISLSLKNGVIKKVMQMD